MCIESIILTSYGSVVKNKFLRGRIFFDEEFEKDLIYPYNEGIFTKTYDISGGYLKNIVLLHDVINPGVYVNIKIIGGLTFKINGQINEYIIFI